MKKIMLVIALATLAGCASNGAVENLQSQIDVLKTSTAEVSVLAKGAQLAAAQASTLAGNAEAAAIRAAQYAQDANAKLDNLFKKTMSK